jgi:hypothetical protein
MWFHTWNLVISQSMRQEVEVRVSARELTLIGINSPSRFNDLQSIIVSLSAFPKEILYPRVGKENGQFNGVLRAVSTRRKPTFLETFISCIVLYDPPLEIWRL